MSFFCSPVLADERAVPLQLTLSETIQRVLDKNPTLLVAREEIRRAQALVEEARAQSLPTLTGTGTYTRLNQSRDFMGTVTEPENQLNLTATLTVPLVNPRTWALWSHAGDNVDIAKTSAYDTRRVIAVAAGHAYLAVFAQKRLYQANVRARDTAKGHYAFARSRFDGGVGTELDVVRAAQQLSVDEGMVNASRAAIVRAQEALSILVGVDVPVDSTDEPTLAAPPALAQATELATTRRSDVIAQDKKREAADHVSRDNWTEYSPYLAGMFAPFYQNPPTSLLPGEGWQAEVVLTVPFYDGGLRYGLGKERAALAREARTTLDGTVRQARSDVRATYETLEQAVATLQNDRQASTYAARALVLANLAYREGATTNLEVIDAEQTARDSEIQAEIAADSARQAQIDALSAVGQFP